MNIDMDTTGSNGIRVELAYPPMNEETFEIDYRVPIMVRSSQGGSGSFPEKLTLHGNAPSGVTGTIYLEMRNVYDDRREFANRIWVQSSSAAVRFTTDRIRLSSPGPGSTSRFTVNQRINGSFEIPLTYHAGASSYLGAFTSVPFELFVRAEVAGGYSERTGRGRSN